MVSVVAIYSVNLVVSRYSVLRGLTAYDLTALRYAVAGVVLLPYFFFRLGARSLGGLRWHRAIIFSCLAGAPYMVVLLLGLDAAPATHAAVLNPGVVPSVVFIGLVTSARQQFSMARMFLLVLIVLGVVMVTGASFSARGPVLVGDALLLGTGISWGVFTLLARIWSVRPIQAATVVAVFSLAYLPPYFLFAYRGFAVSLDHVVTQAIFQGLVNSIVALYLLTYAVRQLGALRAALFGPAVPVLTTLLGSALLGEVPSAVQLAGLVIVVAGMLSSAWMNADVPSTTDGRLGADDPGGA